MKRKITNSKQKTQKINNPPPTAESPKITPAIRFQYVKRFAKGESLEKLGKELVEKGYSHRVKRLDHIVQKWAKKMGIKREVVSPYDYTNPKTKKRVEKIKLNKLCSSFIKEEEINSSVINELKKKYNNYEIYCTFNKKIKNKKKRNKIFRILGLNRHTVWTWDNGTIPSSEKYDQDAVKLITDIHDSKYKSSYGALRIQHEMEISLGKSVNLKKIRRIMRSKGITGNFKTVNNFSDPKNTKVDVPNLVIKNFGGVFKMNKPGMVYYTDSTAFRTKEGSYYVSALKDGYNWEIVGWASSKYNDIALQMQATKNAGVHDCIVHSDHGSAFSSNEYIAYCKNHNITRSMSAVGACAENHPIETFWNILKREGIYRTVPIGKRTNLGIKKETAKFISYYNNERSSNSLNFLSPIQYKKQQEEKNKLLKRKIIKNKKNKKIIKLTKTK